MKRAPLGRYGLAWVLLAFFLISWVIQSFTGWREFKSEQEALGEAAVVFGDSGYIWSWLRATFENWQSEFLQLLTMVVLTAYLIYQGSSESKDSNEQMQASLDRIEQRLETLEKSGRIASANGESGQVQIERRAASAQS
jgi:hypothetical protein